MKCLKCGHEWTPKVEHPARCPSCKTSTYMYPPGVGFATGGVGVISEPKYFGDPTPLITVEEMPLAEAKRRFPSLPIHGSKVKHVPGRREGA